MADTPLYTPDSLAQAMEVAIETAQHTHPLTPSITNSVTVDFVANAQLAAGGSAAMIYLADEACGLAELGASFYVNLGTLLPVHKESIPAVAACCNASATPWVLDPVGIGLGEVREAILAALRHTPPSIVRGNASEIRALAETWDLWHPSGDATVVHGVDATDDVESAEEAAVALARFTGGAVAVSGAQDLITDGAQIVRLRGGSPLMERVTGFGCSLGGVMAVYAATATPLVAACAGSALYNIAANEALKISQGPASFKVAFLDQVANLGPRTIASCPFTITPVR